MEATNEATKTTAPEEWRVVVANGARNVVHAMSVTREGVDTYFSFRAECAAVGGVAAGVSARTAVNRIAHLVGWEVVEILAPNCPPRDEVAESIGRLYEERCDERDALCARVAELEAIVEGRTVPPTDAELDAHEAAGGTWTCTTAGEWIFSDAGMDGRAARAHRPVLAANAWAKPRWWAHDAKGRPCAWPVAPEAPTSSA